MISFGKIPVQFSCSCLVLFTSSVGCFDLPAIIVPLPDREEVCQPDSIGSSPPSVAWTGPALGAFGLCLHLHPFEMGGGLSKVTRDRERHTREGGGRGRQRQRYPIDTSFALAALSGSRCSPNASALMRILWLTWLGHLPYLWLKRRQREIEGQSVLELQLGRVTGPFV